MENNHLLVATVLVSVITLVVVIFLKLKKSPGQILLRIDEIEKSISRVEASLRDEIKSNRDETQKITKENRDELSASFKDLKKEISDILNSISKHSVENLKEINATLENKLDHLLKNSKDANSELRLELEKSLKGVQENFDRNVDSFIKVQKDKFEGLDKKQSELITSNEKKFAEVSKSVVDNLQQINKSSKEFNVELKTELEKSLKNVQDNFDKNVESINKLQKEKFEQQEINQTKLIDSTEKKLELMRETVDEKLQKTLNERLGQSFETVGKQLLEVQAGLGEMRTLALDVGGLKKVLGGVKTRGGIGELQLSLLLEQVLAPEQYEANVKTKPSSNAVVEFAVKLPGQEEGLAQMWLPIDAKFPKDYYEELILAQDGGDKVQIELAHRNLDAAIRKMAKDISDKYIDPPHTTNFGIMFLPFEGLYSEVVRKSSLMEELHRDYKISITGPSTLAAHLNCLQMGFKTLTIQKRSSEVWKVLGAVKNEFDKFGGILEKTQKHFQSGVDDLDTLIGTRSRMIRSKLKSIEALPDNETKLILPDLIGADSSEDEN